MVDVLNLWRVTIRPLALTQAGRTPFVWHIATEATREFDVVAEAKKRFTDDWWKGHIIIAVEEIGELHMFNGKALYEQD